MFYTNGISLPTTGWVPPGIIRRTSSSSPIQTETIAKAIDAARLVVLRSHSAPIVRKKIDDDTWSQAPDMRKLERAARLRICAFDLLSRLKLSFGGNAGTLGSAVNVSALANSWVLSLSRPSIADLDFKKDGTGGLDKLVDPKNPKTREPDLNHILLGAEDIAPFFAALLDLRPELYAATSDLLEVVADVTYTVAQRSKFHLNVPRPGALCPQVYPAIPTPSHASYPSGHAAAAYALAAFLTCLTASGKQDQQTLELLLTVADWIAQAREKAGLHFKIDTEAGKCLGVFIGIQTAVAGKLSIADSLESILKTVFSPEQSETAKNELSKELSEDSGLFAELTSTAIIGEW